MVCLSMLSLKQCIIKQLLVSDFVISRLIKVSVSVISLRPRLGWSLVCYILWVLSTSKKPIGILNLKPWTEFDFTPLNRYLRPQLSFISEETLIVSSVTLPSPLEMLSNPVNLPCGTKCWREFNIFGAAILLLFCLLSLSSSSSTLSLSLSLSSSLSQYCWNWLVLLYKTDSSPWGLFIFASFRKSCLIGIFGLIYMLKYKWKIKKGNK